MAKQAVVEEQIGRVGHRRDVVIPREMLKNFNLRAGDLVEFRQQANGVLIKPKRVTEPDDDLTPEQAKRLRQSLKQTRQGKTRPWTQVKHELGL